MYNVNQHNDRRLTRIFELHRMMRLLIPTMAFALLSACGGSGGPLSSTGTNFVPPSIPGQFAIDFNNNGIDDSTDITSGSSNDVNNNGIVDEVEIDFDGNGTLDGRINAGFVFNDMSQDGVQDAGETGLAGVTVTAYNRAGVVAGTDTTAADGSWRINDVATLQGVFFQFSAFPTNYAQGFAGPLGNTANHFVFGSTKDTNLSVQDPNICDANATPRLATACYVSGSIGSSASASAAIVSFPYDAAGQPTSPNPDYPANDATVAQVGTTWGMAYDVLNRRIYAGAMLKRHAGLGPQGTGGIYILDHTTQPATLAASYSLNGIVPSVGPTINTGATNRTADDNNGSLDDNEMLDSATESTIDLDAFGQVGTMAFGDIEVTEDAQQLWIVNLAQESLIRIDISDSAVALLAPPTPNVAHFPLAGVLGVPVCPTYRNGAGDIVPSGELRPWALGFHNGRGYVGTVCSAEYSQLREHLRGHVLSFDPNDMASGFTIELTVPMDYSREDGIGRNGDPDPATIATWRPWALQWSDTQAPNAELPEGSDGFEHFYPQPSISDIEFGDNDTMIIGMADRWGHQMGSSNYFPLTGSNNNITGDSAGDTLIAQLVSTGYVLEGDAAFTLTINDTGPVDGDLTNDGPSGAGEFFYWDSYTDQPLANPYDYLHHEVTIGGLAVFRGTNEVVSVVFDPTFSAFSQGTHVYDVTDGSRPRVYRVTDNTGGYGKANGLGDIEIVCDEGPVQIGSTVFADNNENGEQDAGDSGIAGIEVELWYQGAVIACTTTDANGNYYFTSGALIDCTGAASTHVLDSCNTTDYQLRINPTSATNTPVLNGAAATSLDNVSDETRDSDGDDTTVAGFIIADVDMPCPGEVDHDTDFGFLPIGCIGDKVWNDADLDANDDGTPTELGLVGVTVRLLTPGPDDELGTADDVIRESQNTGALGEYKFAGLPPGPYRVIVDETTVPSNMSLTTGNLPLDYFLSTNENYQDADFGYALPIGRIGDRVWLDNNGNQVQDDGATGIVGVTVRLCTAGPDGNFEDGAGDDVVVATDVTGTDGVYLFQNLGADTYQVKVDESTLTPATVITTTNNDPATVVLGVSEQRLDVDFGYVDPVGCIGNRIWDDVDGLQDQGPAATEPGLNGVDVQLIGPGPDGILSTADDVVLQTETTATDGDYKFGGLPPGDYLVNVVDTTLPANYASTTNNDPFPVSLTLNEDFQDADFGYMIPQGCIGNRIWNDVDTLGDQNAAGEPGLNTVSVQLIGPGPDGTLGNVDDVLLETQQTTGDGAYKFAGLLPGPYRVNVVESTVPANFLPTTANNPLDYNLGPNEDYQDADFGYALPIGCIGDRVWHDFNADTNQGAVATEPGLDNVLVRLFEPGPDGTIGTADDVERATQSTTGGNGAYKFLNLPPQTYRVVIDTTTLPNANFLPTTPATVDYPLALNEDYRGADFGFVEPRGCIGDRVWNDFNADTIQDGVATEPGIDNVLVRLFEPGPDGTIGTADDVERATLMTTGGNGAYKFANLPPGDYRVVVDETTLPANTYVPTTPNTNTVSLALNQDYQLADFGYVEPRGCLGDRVWNDVDLAGDQDAPAGEPGLVGVRMNLITPGPDGTLGTADDVTAATQLTIADGMYKFLDLAPGMYRVAVDETTVPAEYIHTTTNNPETYTLGLNEDVRTLDFGYAQPIGCIGDRVWHDFNADTNQGAVATEPGLDNVLVRLFEPGPDGVINTADDVERATQMTTGGNGGYKFLNLPAQAYRVVVDTTTLPTATFLATTPTTVTYTLALNEDYRGADFGFVEPRGCIGDRVWDDVDVQGDQDAPASEPGLVGVTMNLCTAGPDMVLGTADDVTEASQMTVADGFYKFTDLAPNTYRVKVDETTVPPGYRPTTIVPDVTLGLNEDRSDVDFGYALPIGCIGDRVWSDIDGQGDQDAPAGEPGFTGVTMRLCTPGVDGTFGNADDVVQETQMTGTDGAYKFINLTPGMYQVKVDETTLPAGNWVSTTGNNPFTYTLALNEDVRIADFGYIESYVIGDQLFTDPNENGQYEPAQGEQPIPNALIKLCDANTGAELQITLTDAQGRYEFRVPPGQYTVKVDPINYNPGGPLEGYRPTNNVDGTTSTTITTGDDLTQLFGFNRNVPTARRHFCGWWVENFSQWPTNTIVIGNQTLNAQQALTVLRDGSSLLQGSHSQGQGGVMARMDMSYVLAWALIGAKLNVAGGNNPAPVAAQIAQADQWFAAIGGISRGVFQSHPRYAEGLALFRAIDAWNRGDG